MKTLPRLAIYHGRENKEKNNRGETGRYTASGGNLALHAHFTLHR